MKTGFKDPIAPKIKEKKEKSPWNYDSPPYDERTSCYVSAGTHFGVGHKTPIGKDKASIPHDSIIPKGRVKTLHLYANGRQEEIIQN